MQWGSLLVSMFFFIGLIGGFAGSDGLFRQIFPLPDFLFSSIRSQIR